MPAPDRHAERQRLLAHMDAYLQCLRQRDFSALKCTPGLRNTDNGVPLPLGNGSARTIRQLHEKGQYFVDVHAGQVAFWGVAEQIAGPFIYGVRLKIEGQLVAEIETLLVGNTDPYFFPQVILTSDPAFHDIVPPEQRCDRGELIDIANLYFDAIEQNDGSLVPVRDDCLRLVNGAEDTVTDVSDMGQSEAHRALGVRQQMSEGHYGYIEALRGRRFPLVDEERGLVIAHVLFDHPGDIGKPNGEIPFGQPNSMLAFEAFKIAGGQIQAVWAICYTVNYGMASGWPQEEHLGILEAV
ncbi:MAG TPA: hypothetical protein VN222_09925 [Novosphingobium sp.]|nr:hypothetical protein [Novosphingobium sp.]